jgi:hypothetical protein
MILERNLCDSTSTLNHIAHWQRLSKDIEKYAAHCLLCDSPQGWNAAGTDDSHYGNPLNPSATNISWIKLMLPTGETGHQRQ